MNTKIMKIPNSARKKALIIVDVQPAFLTKRNDYIIKNITKLIDSIEYDIYVETIAYAERGSIWEKQTKSIYPKNEDFHTHEKILAFLKDKKSIHLEKDTKSAFKGDVDLIQIFRRANIEEAHVVGLDTNDCVLATAFEAFDNGFFTYVIEECTESSSSLSMRIQALAILRQLNLTNHSVVEEIVFRSIICDKLLTPLG